jgi:hypothetical protein
MSVGLECRWEEHGEVEVVPCLELPPALVRRAGDRERVDHLLADGLDHSARVTLRSRVADRSRLPLEPVKLEHHVEVRDH